MLSQSPWTLLPNVASFSYALPVAASAHAGRLSSPLKLIVLYSAATLAEALLLTYLSNVDRVNLWLVHAYTPFEATVLLLAMSRWQVRELARTTVMLSIPTFLVLWAALSLTAESLAEFPQYVKSVEAILLVAVAAFTLVTRSRNLVVPIGRQPWFWVTVGVMIYFAFLAILNPMSNALLRRDANVLLMGVYQVNAALIIVHNILFVWAIRCQQQQANSGGSSLPRQSLASS